MAPIPINAIQTAAPVPK